MHKHIVLVEDNPDDAALTLRAFRKSSLQADVRVFQDGIEALAYLQGSGLTAQPDVILLDLKLPLLDGLEVLARLRAHPETRLVPVVMLTTSQEQDDLVRSYTLGANSYIRKPVDFNRFVEVIQAIGLYWLSLNETPHKS
jgi:two-component system response regulator